MRFRLSFAAVLALLAVFAFWVWPHMRVETNLLALLPSTAEKRVQLDAVKKFAGVEMSVNCSGCSRKSAPRYMRFGNVGGRPEIEATLV